MLKIKNLTKTYGEKCAVDNFSLTINVGEICAFIGHNGAGKTTTIKSCCGILKFDSGEIFVDGHSIKTDPIKCKQTLAYIPDTPDLYDFMTGTKFLNFVADIYRVPSEARQERVQKYAKMLEMTENLDKNISAYSHGMKQKLAIISALIRDSKIIILDEPFVGLDPKSTHSFKEIMRQYCSDGGAIFFSTHILEVAEKLCDKVAIIKDGKLVAKGNMDEVRGNASLEEVFLELGEKSEGENA